MTKTISISEIATEKTEDFTKRVNSLRSDGINKVLNLGNGFKLSVPIFTCVCVGDTILFIKNGSYVVCQNGLARIYPSYKENEAIQIGNKNYQITIKEIASKEELEAQEYLANFHYRNKVSFGKRTRLIITSEDEFLPRVLGYVELICAPILNKPRNRILDAPFSNGDIKWDKWNYQTIGKYSKTIVSISRIVIHPEFRGLGLSQLLLKHSFKFARDYWQVGKMKPLFMEIVADMLKYVPFAEKAGMHYIGDTEGNISRLKKDMKYYIKKQNQINGMSFSRHSLIRMQSHYLRGAVKIIKEMNFKEKDFISEISKLDANSIEDKYHIYHEILRLPKPTYLIGLTECSEEFLRERTKSITNTDNSQPTEQQKSVINSLISFRNVSLEFKGTKKMSKRTFQIQRAFGIGHTDNNHLVFSNFNFDIQPGEIILVTGSSGNGKTAFLKLLSKELKPTEGEIILPSNCKIAALKPLDDNAPLIEKIGNNFDKALLILNKVGLAEVNIYLKNFSELSTGQQHRAMLAKLIDSNANIWIADEFLSSLDRITANITAENIRKFAKMFGITLIIAASNYENFIYSLRPDKVLIKSFGWDYKIYTGQQLIEKLSI